MAEKNPRKETVHWGGGLVQEIHPPTEVDKILGFEVGKIVWKQKRQRKPKKK